MKNGWRGCLLRERKLWGMLTIQLGLLRGYTVQLSIMREEDAHRACYITEHSVLFPEALLILHISRVFTSFVVLCVVFVWCCLFVESGSHTTAQVGPKHTR